MFLASRCINISGKRLVDMKINANILFFNDTKLNDMIKIDFYRVYYIFISPRQHNQLLSTPDYCLFLAKVGICTDINPSSIWNKQPAWA